MRRAEAVGHAALVVTVAAPVNGLQNRTQRAGFALPEQVKAVNLRNMSQSNPLTLGAEQSIVFQGLIASALTWADLKWLHPPSPDENTPYRL